MANTFYNGKETVLLIDTTTPVTTAYTAVTVDDAVMVACLDTDGFELSNALIDVSSKCSDGNFAESIGGQQSWTMSADGKFIVPVNGELSNNELFKLARTNAPFWAFLFDPTLKRKMRYGVAYITSFTESNDNNAAETFSLSLTGSGYIGDQDDIMP